MSPLVIRFKCTSGIAANSCGHREGLASFSDYSYENAHLTFMEINERAFSSMSFPGPGREGG